MSKHLPVPPDMQHLIEKRAEADRRKRARRARARRQVDLGPLGALESVGDLDQVVLEERRVAAEQRSKLPDRRRGKRRAGLGKE